MADMGRPTDYKEEYCEEIIKLAKQNVNLYLIAEEFGVVKQTLLEWKRVHKEFSCAYTRAANILSGILQKRVDDNLENKNFNAPSAKLLFAQNRMSEQRNLEIHGIAEGTLNDSGKAVLNSVGHGLITADEMQKSINAIAQLAKIDEVTDLRDKVEKLEAIEGN